ncbi:transglycosylase domain-containing protein [Halobacillus karajensis]|uniref:Penicillin-binding protein 1A/1B n=1 Tax=Halobacillus karajensis TaxID=195088 RepID=A0A024P7F7_9BACI|nr:transglycosylase domain-containing protein [Halobacillus karajensis]CDQ18319.1 Penicillin-binding protein 1A/1B [Halobacillus karajensis]CDQ24673.1 Penicillin-binding protein 1A/1B [Halobacillus karajensis]CDQ29081.1 Penicillin-binding protein 1A/1B [Halobacillus karajensis]
MFNNQKNGRKKLDFRSLWESGTIQKNSRITYDVVWNVILFFIIIGVIGLFFAGGVGAGYFASLVKDEEVRSEENMKETIYNYAETSTMYFNDENEIGDIRSDLYREEVQLDQVSEHLKNAVIATEDEYFGEHKGVVPKAVMRAVVQEVTNSSVKSGGSTLTQQLVKNQILTNEVSFERKAKEMLLALRVERFLEKDEILEAYLNIVSLGRNSNGQNVAGVQTAAQGIFGVDAKDLTLAQSAYIAGMPQSPFGYTPFYNDGSIKEPENLQPGIDRMHEVLERMLEAGYITKAEYDEAMEFQINEETLADPKATVLGTYPAINQEVHSRAKKRIKEYLMEKNGHTEEDLAEDESLREEYNTMAERELSSGGYKIHTTIDKEVYDAMQKVRDSYTKNNWPWGQKTVLNNEGQEVKVDTPLQLGSMIIENSTGKIYGFIGGYDFEEENMNHATQARRSNGSTMKPLLVYGPSFDMGAAQPGSVIADVPYYYNGGKEVRNFSRSHRGFVSARYALANSYNVPAVKQYNKILDQNPVKNYLEKMGMGEDLVKQDYSSESMALGGLSYGVTVENNINAYATFGNMGKFVDAYMIEKIETKDGETIYEHETEETDVFSPQAAYLTIDVMRDVLDYGTGQRVRGLLYNRGVDWAGKTGTSQSTKDSWFVATNPNVTVGMWTGFAEGNMQHLNYNQRTQGLWADVVNSVSEIRPELMIPTSGFQSPGGLVTRSYCATSGLLASNLCSSIGLAKSDIYDANYAPSKVDDSLISGDFVRVKDQLVVAGQNTPSEFIIDGGGVTLSPEFLKENGYTSSEVLRELLPNSGAWSKVALPSTQSVGSTSSSIDNDGRAPAAPNSVKNSGSSISWAPSSSNDVVGYRVYRASTPGGSFSLIGSTVDHSLSFSGDEGIYAVRAVDYFGETSGLSETITVGNPGETDPSGSDSGSSGDSEGDSGANSNSGNSDSDNGQSNENDSGESESDSEEGNSDGGESGSGDDSSESDTDSESGNGDNNPGSESDSENEDSATDDGANDEPNDESNSGDE